MNIVRESNFKIGCFHGKLNPQKNDSEAIIRNDIYHTGMVKIEETKKRAIPIRACSILF